MVLTAMSRPSNFGELRSVGSDLTFDRVSLTAMNMSRLETIGSSVWIHNCNQLKVIRLTQLQSITWSVQVRAVILAFMIRRLGEVTIRFCYIPSSADSQ